VPLVLPPGKMSIDLSNLTATITLPLTGGSIDLTTFNGEATAGGSIVFTKLFPLRIVRLTWNKLPFRSPCCCTAAEACR